MNKFFLLILILFSEISFASSNDAIDLESLKSYMRSLKNISANFIQIDKRGQSQSGKFYLSRPGKMRWEYQDPKELVIVLNNNKIYYYDKELDQVSHYIGNYGMLDVLIENDIFTSKKFKIDSYISDEEMTNITFKSVEDSSSFTLVFNSDPLRLLGCVLEEESGNKVNLKFISMTEHLSFDPSLFQLRQSLSPQR
ncbi:MAG: outer membrane lipoprotein carrier protein LolA [Alphaproteobacteria bacterium]|nr:outer membrane lipoprotein carrier protein LolA [Alphaproteobacteria bacterium]